MVKEAMVKAAAEINRLQTIVNDSLLEKRATAVAVTLLKEGHITANEFMAKVADLKSKNLDVIEEAIKLGYSHLSTDLGTVDSEHFITSDNPLLAALLNH